MPTQWNVDVDFGQTSGAIKALHGANNGPLCFDGLIDLSESYRELGLPWLRLHDCNWPADNVVDTHVVFPCFSADPDDPASYDFALTDLYIDAIRKTGARVVYRLGCRIEHYPHRRHAHPPADFTQWARICRGIIRHYTEGWANGHTWDLRHWEIWNEPDVPPGCWSGTWDQYFDLYVTTAALLKRHHPDMQIGGPAFAYPTDDTTFVERFLQRCTAESAPVDFLSWHTYAGSDLSVWRRRAGCMRALLDANGFGDTESHLNEWNCHPGVDWTDWSAFTQVLRGPVGAAGVAASLIYFQDLPIDMAFLYTADISTYGLHDQCGARQTNWYAVKAFRQMLDTPVRCVASGSDDTHGQAVLAGVNSEGTQAQLLLVNYVNTGAVSCTVEAARWPWKGPAVASVFTIDGSHQLACTERVLLHPPASTLRMDLPEATVLLVQLRPD